MDAELVAACRAAPDDDGPREVLADSLGGERGELVMLQLALDRGAGTPEQRRRARRLAAEHGAAWSGLDGLAHRVTFRRGFVDAIEVRADVAIAHCDELFARAPLCEHVMITGLVVEHAGPRATPLDEPLRSALAVLPRLRGLFVDVFVHREGEHATQARYAHLLDGLDVESLGLAGDQLPAEPTARRFWWEHRSERTRLPSEPIALRFVSPRALVGLPATVTELEVLGESVADLEAPQLERLTVDLAQLAFQPGRLARFPNLRSLTISDFARAHVEAPHLVAHWEALRHPALREVRAIDCSEAAVFALARALGPQLDLLDVRGSAAELHLHHAELQALVAGDVVTGGHVDLRPLSWLGRRPRELMWDHALVELRR